MKEVILKYVRSFVISLLVFATVALIVNKLFRSSSSPSSYLTVFRIIYLSCLSASVLGQQGWSIQTFDGKSRAEKANDWIFIILATIGILLTGFDLFVGYAFE